MDTTAGKRAPRAAIKEATEVGMLHSLEGKRFAITGKLSMTRRQIQEVIEGAGGRFLPVVTNAQFLIAGEQQANRSSTEKLEYAERMRIPIISEDDFTHMLLHGLRSTRT